MRKQNALIFTKTLCANLSKLHVRLWRHLTFHDICYLGPHNFKYWRALPEEEGVLSWLWPRYVLKIKWWVFWDRIYSRNTERNKKRKLWSILFCMINTEFSWTPKIYIRWSNIQKRLADPKRIKICLSGPGALCNFSCLSSLTIFANFLMWKQWRCSVPCLHLGVSRHGGGKRCCLIFTHWFPWLPPQRVTKEKEVCSLVCGGRTLESTTWEIQQRVLSLPLDSLRQKQDKFITRGQYFNIYVLHRLKKNDGTKKVTLRLTFG